MSSKDENENENENKNENENENENENDHETVNQNKIIKEKKNDLLDKIIDKSKSFEDQIESLKKVENLDD